MEKSGITCCKSKEEARDVGVFDTRGDVAVVGVANYE